MKMISQKTKLTALCVAGLIIASSLPVAAQTPGTLPYFSEIEITKDRLLSVEQYELAKTFLSTEYHAIADFYIGLVNAGHEYEYGAYLWADSLSNKATTVYLTFPNGQTKEGSSDGENNLVFSNWTNEVYSFEDLKTALPPGTYSLAAYFPEGAGTNYTAVLPDYTEDDFPPFVPGKLTWSGVINAPLELYWETIPGVEEYEILAEVFPVGPSVYYSGNLYPTHPQNNTNILSGTVVNTNFYGAYIQAERDVDSGDFHHEFSSWTDFLFLPATLANPGWTASGEFQCDVLGGNGSSYMIQGSTNFSDWASLSTNTAINFESFQFKDPGADIFKWRYYRAVLAPAP